MLNMTNCTPDKMEYIWNSNEHNVNIIFHAGRGKKSAIQPKYCLLMSLTVMKYGVTWEFSGQILNCKNPNSEPLILKFLSISSPLLYEKYVNLYERKYTV